MGTRNSRLLVALALGSCWLGAACVPCGSGEVREGGTCVRTCDNDTDCDQGQVCVEERCVEGTASGQADGGGSHAVSHGSSSAVSGPTSAAPSSGATSTADLSSSASLDPSSGGPASSGATSSGDTSGADPSSLAPSSGAPATSLPSSGEPPTSGPAPSSSSSESGPPSSGPPSSSTSLSHSCGLCQTPTAGGCRNQTRQEDLYGECPDDLTCMTGFCDGAGHCESVGPGLQGNNCQEECSACDGYGICRPVTPCCGNGVCEAAEQGFHCGRDCCDAFTGCDVVSAADPTKRCRSINGAAHAWVTEEQVGAACDQDAEQCVSTLTCAGTTSCCTAQPGTWTAGVCPACCDDGDCPTCKKCSGGRCLPQSSQEDLKDECAAGTCRTGLCDGLGACDWDPVDCGTCHKCTGLGVCSPDDTQHADCGTCQKCSGGTCVAQLPSEDLKSECPTGTCLTSFCGVDGQCGNVEPNVAAPGCDGLCQACTGGGACGLATPCCGNGTCDNGETGAGCPQECCDATTPCAATRGNDGVTYCRSVNSQPHAWMANPELNTACDQGVEQCVSTFVCHQEPYCCTTVPGVWSTGLCPECCAHQDCGTCQKCVAGQCVPQTRTEDLKDECAEGTCASGFCDGTGSGACGWEVTGCGPCHRCTGLGACVEDNTLHATCPTCQKCETGSCVNQTAVEDLKNDCADDGTCITGYCSGTGPTCNMVANRQPGRNCTAPCRWCNGAGQCITQPDGEDFTERCDKSPTSPCHMLPGECKNGACRHMYDCYLPVGQECNMCLDGYGNYYSTFACSMPCTGTGCGTNYCPPNCSSRGSVIDCN